MGHACTTGDLIDDEDVEGMKDLADLASLR